MPPPHSPRALGNDICHCVSSRPSNQAGSRAVLPTYLSCVPHPGAMPALRVFDSLPGLVPTEGRKQASGLCTKSTLGFALGETSLWVPSGCEGNQFGDWGMLRIRGPSTQFCRFLWSLRHRPVLSICSWSRSTRGISLAIDVEWLKRERKPESGFIQ